MFYFDPTYIVILPALILSLWASFNVKLTFNKNSRIMSQRGYTAAMACRTVLDRNGLYHVKIERVGGSLTDHYDPRANVIRLSDSVYNSTSVAAIGVACHEAGHAVQHAQNYLPIRIRQAIIPITTFGSSFGLIIFLLGVLLTIMGEQFIIIAYIGIALFSLTAVFQLITLPVEFNASRRAMEAIKEGGILYENELGGAKSVLKAAALTYVAALASTLSQVLRLLLILSRANNRRR